MGISGNLPKMGSREMSKRTFVATGVELDITPPPELNQEARRVWTVVLTDLIANKVFREPDMLMLQHLCQLMALAKDDHDRLEPLRQQLDDAEHEVDVMTPDDFDTDEAYYKAIGILEKRITRLEASIKRSRVGYLAALKEARMLAQEFGVSPVSRMRLGLMQVTGAGLMEALGGADEFGDGDEDIVEGEVVGD